LAGRYTLWAGAVDRAGNMTPAGPFEVDTTCLSANLAVSFVSAEVSADLPLSITLSARVSHTGVITEPGAITVPAGLVAGFYDGTTRIASAATTQPLGPASLKW